MCGIFAYLNFHANKERRYILDVLFNGLRRLEYRGYDSAGIAIDNSSPSSSPLVFRQAGNIESLVNSVNEGYFTYGSLNFESKVVAFLNFCVLLFLDFCRDYEYGFESRRSFLLSCWNCTYEVGYSW